MIFPLEVNYYFHDELAHVLAYVHDVFIFGVSICWIAMIYLQRKFIVIIYLQVTNAFVKLMIKLHMTTTYIARVRGVSPVLSEKLAHVVPT
jgi:hypothetical protein